MDPRLRTALIAVIAAIVAVFLGQQIAEGSYGWPALATLVILASVLVRFIGIPADIIFVGFLLVGYIVGNRGFAQLMPAPGVPLLPAEAGLIVALTWRGILCSFERRLPFQRDALNWVVLLWLVAGSARVVFDFPRYGLMAARDYAVVYYALFFFLVQHMARSSARARGYLFGCLLTGVIAVGPVYMLFDTFQDFFTRQLTVNGSPLIYYKGDLAGTFMVIGALIVFHWARGPQRQWAWPLAAALFLIVLAGDNRASLLAAAAASLLLLLARHWRFPVLQGGAAALGLMVVLGLSLIFNDTWANRKLHGLTDRVQSIVDISGTGHYESTESYNKGDNNRFRLVWWKNVAIETWDTNPIFGLGFGADLAAGFLQEYYPDNDEAFTTRSPHNIFLTAFGRMGFVGVAVWLAFCLTLIARTWRMLRLPDNPMLWSLWCSACALLCSAVFGVVLEGPMGAVVFWTMLGLANAIPQETAAVKVVANAIEPAQTAELPAV